MTVATSDAGTMGERIRRARVQAGYDTIREFAAKLNIDEMRRLNGAAK